MSNQQPIGIAQVILALLQRVGSRQTQERMPRRSHQAPGMHDTSRAPPWLVHHFVVYGQPVTYATLASLVSFRGSLPHYGNDDSPADSAVMVRFTLIQFTEKQFEVAHFNPLVLGVFSSTISKKIGPRHNRAPSVLRPAADASRRCSRTGLLLFVV